MQDTMYNNYLSLFVTGAMATKELFINYEWPVAITGLNCYGNESTIWTCLYNETNDDNLCLQDNDASVFCLRKLITQCVVKL